MKRHLLPLAVSSAVAVALLGGGALAAATVEQPALPSAIAAAPEPIPAPTAGPTRTVTVVGSGSVKVVPDTATISVGVEVNADSGGAVMEQLAAHTTALLDTLTAEGFAEEQVTTSDISLWPRYGHTSASSDPYAAPPVVGYTGSVTMSVRVDDIEQVGPTLDLLQQSVGDDFRINGLWFSHSDPESLRDQPRTDAVHAARAKAEVLAAAAGAELGEVLAISEGGAVIPMAFARAEAAFDGAMPQASINVAPGQLELTVDVTVTFELLTPAS